MWRARPVFISSTFADMQAERDYLRTRVFPELEERLRERRHYLAWVDLRLGVATGVTADEGAREAEVLKHCLAEVQRCRPFLIVLLGDRYGWVPPTDRLAAAGFGPEAAGRSVTDLEIELGVLADPAQPPRSIFYFREPLPYADMQAEIAALYSEDYTADAAKAERKERLAALKRRIETRLPGRMVPYRAAWDSERQRVTGLEDFGRMVLDDIWSELEAETGTSATAADIPWEQAERDALEDFIDDRARDFVGREAVIARLSDLCHYPAEHDNQWGLCLTGEPGSGKSALFGALYRRLGESEVFLLAHASSASVAAASVDSMLRRWIGEIAAALHIDPCLAENADADTIDAVFARLLGQMVQQRRVVVLLDALDQFENTTRGRFATWLPRLWPANARLIATAIAGDASKAVAERPGVEATSLPPLDATEARGIIDGICKRYGRKFDPKVIEALLAKMNAGVPAWGNPLWLVLEVEELNLLDADDFARAQRSYSGHPTERLRDLMADEIVDSPPDIPGLYNHTFARAEKLFGENLTRAFLGLIAVSRAGWRESDFRILLPRTSGEDWDELKFAQLRRIFRGQMRQRGALAQWDFNHAQMRAATLTRLAAHDVRHRAIHAIIVDHLLSCRSDDPLRITETMVHLLGSEDWTRAARYYGDATLTDAELQGATRALSESVLAPANGSPNSAIQNACRLLDTSDIEDSIQALVANRFVFNLESAIEYRTPLDCHAVITDRIRQTFERLLQANPESRNRQRDLCVSHIKLGDVQQERGDLAGALKSYRSGHVIAERLARSDPGNSDWQRDLEVSQSRLGDVQRAQGDLAGALKSYSDSLAVAERLARSGLGDPGWQRGVWVSYGNVGDVQMAQGDLGAALKSYRESLVIAERLARSDPSNTGWQRDLAASYERIGDVQLYGDLAAAIKSYRDSLAIREHLARSDPTNAVWQHNLAVSYSRIGDVHVENGDLAGALKSYRDSHAIHERLARSDPGNVRWQHSVSVSYSRIGNVQGAQADLAGAPKSYCDSLAICDHLVHSDPSSTEWQRDLSVSYYKVGDVQMAQGDLTGALKSCRDSLAIAERLAQSDPCNAGWQLGLSRSYEMVGNVQRAQADLSGALKSFCDSLAIVDRLVHSDPGNARWQYTQSVLYDRLGDVQVKKGGLAGALKSYGDSLAIRKRLARSDPTNARWQQTLSISHDRIGTVEEAQGDLAGALKSYSDSLVIRERLARSNPSNTEWQNDLSVLYNKVGLMQMAQGDLTGAHETRRHSDALREQLAQSNSGNAP
jgi:tetratricopeptide (TPR) repeat protein